MALKEINPANVAGKSNAERKRIPMSVPVLRLEVPDIPGYHLHWFKNTAERLQRAHDAGYEFVEERDVKLNNTSLGGDSAVSGNTDMGSRVSVVAGSEVGHDGQPSRLVLMKIKQEWYEEDQKLVDEKNAQVANALTNGSIGAEKDSNTDARQRYVDKQRTVIPDLFKAKRRIAA